MDNQAFVVPNIGVETIWWPAIGSEVEPFVRNCPASTKTKLKTDELHFNKF